MSLEQDKEQSWLVHIVCNIGYWYQGTQHVINGGQGLSNTVLPFSTLAVSRSSNILFNMAALETK